MGVLNINVEIVSGNNIGGVFPFVVACFDNDLNNELHKTSATTAGPRCVWEDDNSFSVDLTAAIKQLHADGKAEPTYLTLFAFDTGAPGVPALGSCGVLLATVRDKGIAKGDFPLVNGTGSLTVIVSAEKGKAGGWFQSDKAKLAGTVGAVGLGALAAGLGAMAVNKHREKKKNAAAAADAEEDGDGADEDDDDAPDVDHPDDDDVGDDEDDDDVLRNDGGEVVDDRAFDPAQHAQHAQLAGAAGAAALAAGASAAIPSAVGTQAEYAAAQQAQAQGVGPGPGAHAMAPHMAAHMASAHAAMQAAPASYAGHAGGAAALPPSAAAGVGAHDARPWWDPETSGDDDGDDGDAHEDAASAAGGAHGYGPGGAGYGGAGAYGRPGMADGPDPYAARGYDGRGGAKGGGGGGGVAQAQ